MHCSRGDWKEAAGSVVREVNEGPSTAGYHENEGDELSLFIMASV